MSRLHDHSVRSRDLKQRFSDQVLYLTRPIWHLRGVTIKDPLANALAVVLYSEVRAADLTLKELGEQLGLSEQTLQRYLSRREREMPASVLTRTARIIGVPLRDLVAAAERRVEREEDGPTRRSARGA